MQQLKARPPRLGQHAPFPRSNRAVVERRAIAREAVDIGLVAPVTGGGGK